MGFVWINKQGVKSSAGFVLQRIDRFSYHYIENQKVLKVPVENGLVDDLYLDPNAQWEPPFENEKLKSEDIDRVCVNLQAAMAFKDMPCRILRRKQ